MKQGYLLNEIESVLAALYDEVEHSGGGSVSDDKIKHVIKLSETFKVNLCDAVFRLKKERQVCLLIESYHSVLVLLMDEALERTKSSDTAIRDKLQYALDDLLYFLEKRFTSYLNLDLEVPPHYVSLSQRTWADRLERLRACFMGTNGEHLFDFVRSNLLRFINADRHKHLSLKALMYRKEIVSEIEILAASPKMIDAAKGLRELLVYMNYNSRGYLEYYTGEIAQYANGIKNAANRKEYLNRMYTKVKKLYCNTLTGLHSGKDNIKAMISGWYEEQLTRLEGQGLAAVEPFGKKYTSVVLPPPGKTPKIFCTFSANHLAILFRGAVLARLIRVHSLSALFRLIVPYLATPRKEELSANAVRGKAYLFTEEERDEVITMLQQLIEKVRNL